jgi:hypothetical protein
MDVLYLKNEWIENKRIEIFEYESVIDLIRKTSINQISYSNLLNCFEWQFKRFKILVRDNFCCVDCGEIDDRLHVHHKYYIKDTLAWEIDDSALVSLCRKCHLTRHENEIIQVYIKVDNSLNSINHQFGKCPRCFGSGYLPEFNHIEGGICFLCYGDFVDKTIFSDRLNEVCANTHLYNVDEHYNNCLDFINLIPLDFYINHIHDKLYSEISSLLAPHNAIIYVKGESELLDILMAAEEENEQENKVNNEFEEDEDDDLPF